MSKNRNRLVIIGIFALFLVPLLAAVLLERSGYEPDHTVNLGELLDPPQAFPPLVAALEAATPEDPGPLARRWVLVHQLPERCDTACQDTVTQLRQIHIATGRYYDDVAVYLQGDATATQSDTLLAIDETFVLAAPVPLPDASAGTTFIADPEGNLMLRYAPGYNPSDLNKDLKKLLKWSGR